jgi:hypothetical protein
MRSQRLLGERHLSERIGERMALYRLYLRKSADVASWVDADLANEREAVVWAHATGDGFEWELWDYGSAPARQVAISECLSPA